MYQRQFHKPFRTIIVCLLLLLLSGILFGCAQDSMIAAYPISGYIAAAQGDSGNTMSITLFVPVSNTKLIRRLQTDVVGFGFGNAPDDIRFTDFKLSQLDVLPGESFARFDLSFSYGAIGEGVYTLDNIQLLFSSEETVTIPLTPLVFDIGPADTGAEYVNTWSSPGLCSNPNAMLCTYEFAQEVDACKVYYAADKYIQLTPEQLQTGEFTISLDSGSYLNYVRTKLVLEVDGQTYITYGKGCQCGTGQELDNEKLKDIYSSIK